MGLDQNIYKVEYAEYQYYRKFGELHNFLAKYWLKQNPDKSVRDFNCEELVLTEKILTELITALKSSQMPDHNGCFFGSSNEDRYEEAVKLFEDILEQVKKGEKFVYHSWW